LYTAKNHHAVGAAKWLAPRSILQITDVTTTKGFPSNPSHCNSLAVEKKLQQ
jgi:hypothetical protein